MNPIQHPLSAIPIRKRKPVLIALLVITLGVFIALTLIGAPLQTPQAPAGIVSFQVAGNVTQARAVVNSWNETARICAGLSLGLDYLFMVAYAVTLGLACVWVADLSRQRGWRKMATLGVWLAWGQGLAAILDAIENLALIMVLLGPVVSPWPEIALACAVPKFVLVFGGILYALGGAIAGRLLKA